MKKIIPNNIAEYRHKRNLTQAELAAIIGIHKSQLQRLEYGTANIYTMQFDTGLKLAKALKVRPETLFK